MKKILSILTVLVMLFAMTAPAFAEATPPTYTIELTTAADGTALTNHTYEVYQIFTGDLFIDDNDTPEVDSDDKTILSNVKYGQNYGTQNDEVPAKVMEDFAAMNQVYAEFFTAPYPARAAFEVAALPKGALVEIEAIAEVE